jgi:hypothetical protein
VIYSLIDTVYENGPDPCRYPYLHVEKAPFPGTAKESLAETTHY